MGDELERAVRFVESMQNRMVERIVPCRYGSALVHDRLPRVWNLNFMRLEHDDPLVTAEDVIVDADGILGAAGLPHRKIQVNIEAVGRRLEPDFRALEWKVTRSLVLRQLDRVASPPPAPVVEVDAGALRPKWEQGIRSAPWAKDNEDSVVQLLEAQLLRAQVVDARYFAGRIDGRLVSECTLLSDGRTAQVESAHTLEEYRGRGLASAVIARAVDEAQRAGHDLVFLLADDDDWPKELYRKLGFATIGRVWDLVRIPPG